VRAAIVMDEMQNSALYCDDLDTCLTLQHATSTHVTQTTHTSIKALPADLLLACSSLATLQLRGNPITVAQLRAEPGFEAYDARRRARADKRIDGRVFAAAQGATFCEGADVEQWEHHKR
jgi:hypothetical protein